MLASKGCLPCLERVMAQIAFGLTYWLGYFLVDNMKHGVIRGCPCSCRHLVLPLQRARRPRLLTIIVSCRGPAVILNINCWMRLINRRISAALTKVGTTRRHKAVLHIWECSRHWLQFHWLRKTMILLKNMSSRLLQVRM